MNSLDKQFDKQEPHPAEANRWICGGRYVVAWLVPAILCILVKLLTLANGRGFRVIARYLGRVEGLGFPGLSFFERFSLFHSEILYVFLVAPLVLLVLLAYSPRWLKVLIIGVVSVGTSLVLFLQSRSLDEMGDFISLRMVGVALIWGIHDPGANRVYLFTPEFYLVLISLAAIAAILIWARHRDGRPETPRAERKWVIAGLIYFGGALLLSIASLHASLPPTPYQRNILARSVEALWGSQTVDTREFEGKSVAELAAIYRRMVNAPAPEPDPAYFGKMRGANLIIFVLETTPWRFLSDSSNVANFPTIHLLSENSFIARQHFTTYPYTNPALFSVFTSCYPTDGTRSFGEEHPHAQIPSLARTLSAVGYDTALYMPSALHGDADISTFHDLGFARYVTPDAAAIQQNWPPGFAEDWKGERIARDRAMLQIAKHDLQTSLAANRRFAIAIAPQIGHLPWPDQPSSQDENDIESHAHAVLAKEDSWLGEITQLLAAHRQLDNTVIVIFGDHGIRTRREDPNFSGASLDDYSFHVPLFIYAPRALTHRLPIYPLTSHIDIAPTILDLLGIERDRLQEQGAPIWNRAIEDRVTFFFARQAFGTDGFYAGSQFFMWNQLEGSVSYSQIPHFQARNVVARDSEMNRNIPARIRRMIAFDQVWMEKLSSAEK